MGVWVWVWMSGKRMSVFKCESTCEYIHVAEIIVEVKLVVTS